MASVIRPQGRFMLEGPDRDSPIVWAWSDDCIKNHDLPAWQKQLREEIRRRCQHLEPFSGQVLHASFFGPKRPGADIENLVMYNIGTFPIAGRNGIRFEYGDAVPSAPDGADYRFCYRYALGGLSSFTHWREGRTLASFDWTPVEAFNSDKPLAPVWLALRRGAASAHFPAAASDKVFGIRVGVQPPSGREPVWGGLVKGIVDGVICAFHAHSDTAVLNEAVTRLAKVLPADADEIDGYLRNGDRAVLGEVARLVSPYQLGVKWNPSDDLCVAGEVIAHEAAPGSEHWAIKGEIFELTR